MDLSWNLSQIYKNNEELDDDIDKMKKIDQELLLFKGKLNQKQAVLDYFVLSEQSSKIEEKIISYLFFKKSLDGSDAWVIEKLSELEMYFLENSKKMTFVKQELTKIDTKTLLEWKKLSEFCDYDGTLDDIVKAKRHKLPEKQEKLMIGSSVSANQSELFDCLDNVEIKFGKTINEDGKLEKLTRANYHVFVSSNNKKVRKSARLKMLRAYKAVNQTIACNYISHLKRNDFVAKAYKYKSTLDMCMQGGDLPKDLPRKVVENVTKFLPLVYRYYAWRKNFMKLEKFESCDLASNLFDRSINKQYSLEKAISIIKQALLPLGKDYTDMLDAAVTEDWIDTRYLPNKDSGAYSSNVYGVHPFILMTYDKTQNSVSTLAHEFGHSMHSYYSEHSQPYSKHDYEIFVAEVASTVNEILLSNWFVEHAESKEEKIEFVADFLNTFIATVFRQTEYTEFELFVHDNIDNNVPMSYKTLNDFYGSLQKKYCGKGVKVLPDSKYHWSIVPHFYRDFYVFKYATGFISACAIASKLLDNPEYAKKYRQFLSAGSSKKPCDILKIADVDILDKKTYDQAFVLFEKYLNMLENQ